MGAHQPKYCDFGVVPISDNSIIIFASKIKQDVLEQNLNKTDVFTWNTNGVFKELEAKSKTIVPYSNKCTINFKGGMIYVPDCGS